MVLCAEKPTTTLLKRVVTELPLQLKKVAEEQKYTVTMAPTEGAVAVTDGTITVKISLTSPLLREGKWHLFRRCCSFAIRRAFKDKSRFRVTTFNDTILLLLPPARWFEFSVFPLIIARISCCV